MKNKSQVIISISIEYLEALLNLPEGSVKDVHICFFKDVIHFKLETEESFTALGGVPVVPHQVMSCQEPPIVNL